MAKFTIATQDREVRIETRDDKYYYAEDPRTLQLSTGIPGSTGWIQLTRSESLAVAEALRALTHDLDD